MRHPGIVRLGDVRRLEQLDLPHGGVRPCDEHFGVTLVFRCCQSDDRVEVVTESVGRLRRRPEGQPLGFEIGVLDSEFENRGVECPIFAEPAIEFGQEADLLGVPERTQNRLQRLGVALNHTGRLLRLARGGARCLVGIRHHGSVRRIGGLRELKAEVSGELPGLDELSQDQRGPVAAASREQHDGGETTAGARSQSPTNVHQLVERHLFRTHAVTVRTLRNLCPTLPVVGVRKP